MINFGATLANLGAMLAHLVAMLAHLGAMLAHLGTILAHLGAHVGPSWSYVGPTWAHFAAYVGPSGLIWARSSHKSAHLGEPQNTVKYSVLRGREPRRDPNLA